MNIPLISVAENLFLNPRESSQISPDIFIRGIRLSPASGDELQPYYLYIGEGEDNEIKFTMVDQNSCLVVSKSLPSILSLPDYFNLSLSIFDKYSSMCTEVENMRYQNKPLQEYIPLFSSMMGNPVYIVDSTYKVLAIDNSPKYAELSAIWKHLIQYRYLSFDIITNLRKKEELYSLDSTTTTSLMKSEVFPNPFINSPLMKNGYVIGHFFVVGYNKAITPGNIALSNQLRSFVEGIVEKDVSFLSSRDRGYENFFIHMMTGSLQDKVLIQKQLSGLEWEENDIYAVSICNSSDETLLNSENICRKMEQIHNGKPLVYSAQIITVFRLHNLSEYRKICNGLRSVASVEETSVVLSDMFRGFTNLALYYQQALSTSLHFIPNGSGYFATYSDISITELLRSADREVLKQLVDPSIRALMDYDLQHDTEYLHTLKTYLKNERNIAKTAKDLYIHRNTLLYRIERLNKLIFDNLEDEDSRLRLIMSMKIMDLMQKDKSKGD